MEKIKNWKSDPTGGVCILWDNGDRNVYRYGAENCYDVVMLDMMVCLMISVNPMMRDGFTFPEGLNEPSEGSSL